MTKKTYHETVQHNPDVGVRFYYSKMDEPGLVPFHWHRSLEIIYVIHGELTFTLNHAMTQISDGQFIVVPSGAIHAVSNTPNEAYVLQIPIDFIKNYWPDPESTTFNLDLADSDYQKIADYFGVTIDYLMTGKEDPKEKAPELTTRDKRDIAKDVERIMEKLSFGEDAPASYNGVTLDKEAATLFKDELEIALRRLKLINKRKYTNKRYKK